MQKIKQLPLSEIQKIAAGQVVERPCNVVKELLENSIDAGASKISLYVEAGGQRLIRVVDNGYGMSDGDALICFKRHATSKISTFEQLQTLETFGFRGEALYTIGAVSTVTLITKEQEADYGVKVCFKQGNLLSTEHVSASQGTDISVEDLFANVPARKKFLKKEETEWRIIVQQFQAFCLSYPLIHLQLFSENKLIHNCPPVPTISDRCAQLWDVSFAQNLISLEIDADKYIKVSGVISHQHLIRYNRNQIFFFVNKRWVKNYVLNQALLKGYLNVLPPARYPVAIVDITLDTNLVDVNIHPRKEEVKFLHPKQVENRITGCVKKTLENALSQQLKSNEQKPNLEQRAFRDQASSFTQNCAQKRVDDVFLDFQNSFNKQEANKPSFFESKINHVDSLQQEEMLFKTSPIPKQIAIEITDMALVQNSVKQEEEQYEIIGVLKKTYILLDHAEGILFVDQHAAHERVLFEQFSKRFTDIASIKLVFPEIITMPTDDIQLLLEHAILLHEQGIMFDQFGDNKIIINSIPVHLKSVVWGNFLREIIDILIEHANFEKDEFFTIVNKKLQAQMACKAAVKAGDSVTHQQIIQLLNDLNRLENRFTCPHGRPTSWLLPLYEIEKKFKRKL